MRTWRDTVTLAVPVCGVLLLSLALVAAAAVGAVVDVGSQTPAPCGLHSLVSGHHCLCEPGTGCKGLHCAVGHKAGDAHAQAGFNRMRCPDCRCAATTTDPHQAARKKRAHPPTTTTTTNPHQAARTATANNATLLAIPRPTIVTNATQRCIVKPGVSARYGPLCESTTTAAECLELEPTCQWHAARARTRTRTSTLLETEHGPDLFRQQFDATLADLRQKNPGALARPVLSTQCCGVIRAGMVQVPTLGVQVEGAPVRIVQVEGSPRVRQRWVPNVTAIGGETPLHHWVDAMVKNMLRLGRKFDLTYPEVTIGRSCSDFELKINSGTNWPCWGLSAQDGLYSFGEGHFGAPGSQEAYPDPTAAGSNVAWESRRPIPVWRGSIWFDYDTNYSSLEELEARGLGPHFNMGSDQIRAMIVHFSVDHPERLNARISENTFSKDSLLYRHNATNGLSRLLPHDRIPQIEYLSSHQVVLVLGGIGAAFRLTAHLDWGSCVVLQDTELELWYTKYLVPGTHYVPLARDGSNISAVLHWVHDHPSEIRGIARAGKVFFDTYLAEKPLALTIQYWLVRMAELATEVTEMSTTGSLPPDTHPV